MKPTRGDGKFEGLLAWWRMKAALQAVKPGLRGGDVLDLGCGTHPVFLLQSPFGRKVGMDQLPPAMDPQGVEIIRYNLVDARLPFPDNSFDCVTALAFLEHLEPHTLPSLLRETRRVLKPSGQFIATTPHFYADGLLRLLARVNLVSREEIDEHKSRFWRREIRRLLLEAGFTGRKISVRGFQLGLNILAVAEKD